MGGLSRKGGGRIGDKVLRALVWVSAAATFAVLLSIIGYVLLRGVPHLKPSMFALSYNSENLSMLPSLITTLMAVGISLAVSVPLGVFAAVYLVEYAGSGSRLVKVIRMTTETLSGLPSILYGLFGLLFFVYYLGWGVSLLAGGMTLSIMILPLIIRTAEEGMKSVPIEYREGSYGLGAGRLRTVARVVLPSAAPGILAGVILAIGRIIGETAALIYTAGTHTEIPEGPMASGRTLAVHMYQLSGEGLHVDQAYATAVVLLIVVIGVNAASAAIAKRIAKV